MKSQGFAVGALAFGILFTPALAADDDNAITRLALCKDSWFEWNKSEPEKLKALGAHFRSLFAPHGNDPYQLPKLPVSVMGLRVTQGFPESVGMGVGFSVGVEATFENASKATETALGRKFQKCETGEGMKTCELGIAPQRTVMLMSEDKPGSRQTLIGCYYFYEK
jgi:hypothetical protein